MLQRALEEIAKGPNAKLVKAKAMTRHIQAFLMLLGTHLGDAEATLKRPGSRPKRMSSEEIEQAYADLAAAKLHYLEVKEGLRRRDVASLEKLRQEIDDLETKVVNLVARTQVQRLEERAREVEGKGQAKEMKQFFGLLNDEKPTPIALEGKDGHVDLRTAAQAQVTMDHVKELYQREVKLPPAVEKECREALRRTRPHHSDRPFTVDDLLQALKSKKRSSAGADGIDAGFFIVCARNAPKPFLWFYNYLLEHDVSPDELRVELLSQIPKGNGGTTADCLRTIGVVSVIWGTFSTMSNQRLGNVIEPHIEQEVGGGKSNRGVADLVQALSMAIRWSWIMKELLIVMTLDQSKAFDSVTPRKAKAELAKHVGNGLFQKLLTKFMTDRPAAIRWKGYTYIPFRATRGVPQGSAVSCIIPNVILDPMVKDLKSIDGFGVCINGELFCVLTYVDDIVLFSKSVADAQRMYWLVVKWLKDLGMKLNDGKHEIMVTGKDNRSTELRQMVDDLKIAFKHAKVQRKSLRYLGAFFKPTSPSWDCHWKRRLGCAMALAMKTRHNGAFQNIPSPITQRMVFLAYLRPATLFCVEIGDISAACLRKLEAMQRIALSRCVAQNTHACGPLLDVIAGVQSTASFVDEMKVKWWLQGVSGVVKERVYRGGKGKWLLRRKHQLRYRQHLLLTEYKWCWEKCNEGRFRKQLDAHHFWQPKHLMGTLTMRVLAIFHKVGLLHKAVRILEVLRKGERHDPFETWEALRRILSDIETWHDRRTEKKVLHESTAPCRKQVFELLYKKRQDWRDFKQKYGNKKEWLDDKENNWKTEGVYHKQAKYPRWACLFDEILPPEMYKGLNASGAYRTFWSLMLGIPHWHALFQGTMMEGHCPYCKEKVVARGLHVLYECKALDGIRVDAAKAVDFDARTRAIKDSDPRKLRQVLAGGAERHIETQWSKGVPGADNERVVLDPHGASRADMHEDIVMKEVSREEWEEEEKQVMLQNDEGKGTTGARLGEAKHMPALGRQRSWGAGGSSAPTSWQGRARDVVAQWHSRDCALPSEPGAASGAPSHMRGREAVGRRPQGPAGGFARRHNTEVVAGWGNRELLAFAVRLHELDESLWCLSWKEGAPEPPSEIEHGPENEHSGWDMSALDTDW